VPIFRNWVGTLDGYVNAQIRAQVSGYLLAQDYHEGEFVHVGDDLWHIDPRPLQAALDQAKGRLGQSEAQLGKTVQDVKRYTPLATEGAISQEDLDNAVAANKSAAADVEAARATVEQAALNLAFTRIVSPVDGIAGLAAAQVGNLVGPTTPDLMTVSVVDPIKVILTVSEQEYLGFRKLHPTEADVQEFRRTAEWELTLSNGQPYPLKGKSYAAQRAVDVRTGALQVVGLFPNPERVLRPGMFARVRIQMGVRKDALVVPQRAVIEVQGAYELAVVDADNKAHLRPVVAGEVVGTDRVIEKGLKAGERVIVEGTQKVREGTLVTPKPFAPKAAAEAEPDEPEESE
jgi:membrane fusion protein (multidrug efflux system)